MPATEMTVVIKGDDSSFRQKFLVYETVTLEDTNPSIVECINEAKEQYKGNVESITVRCSMTIL